MNRVYLLKLRDLVIIPYNIPQERIKSRDFSLRKNYLKPNCFRHTYLWVIQYKHAYLNLYASKILNIFVYMLVTATQQKRGGPHDVMVKAMACGIVVSEFVLQSRYYVHFRANTLGKAMNHLILPAMG